ncbi:MAG: HEAT repeat domain-containing protein [Planctomycetes bacterium]|nr:HEAT repeat domain-containing protein [Planctomycetota bacterium]
MTRRTWAAAICFLPAALLAAAAAAQAGAATAATEISPPAAAEPIAAAPAAPDDWGPPGAGLAARLAVEGEVAAGGPVRITVSLRSAAGQAVTLPPAGDVCGWLLAAQTTPGSKKAYYSDRIFFARGAADWPAELAGEKVLTFKSVDVSSAAAYGSQDARQLLTAYLSGQADQPLPKSVGKMGQVLLPGRAGAKFTVCLSAAGGKPGLVTTNMAEFLVGPPDLKTLSPEARTAFEADLMKQFDRDAWSGQQAHDTAVRLGRDMLPALAAAALEEDRPPHARLWLATALADIPDERSVDALIKLLDSPVQGVRYVVAYHGPKQRSARLDKAIIEKARTADEAGVATWALLGFMVHRAAVPEEVLRAGLESDSPQARARAAEVLARHAGPENIARLTGLLGDRDERVRGTAAGMLAKSKVHTPPVLGALVKALDLPGENARRRICDALSELTGQARPYDPAADAAAREKTIAAWKEWGAKQGAK